MNISFEKPDVLPGVALQLSVVESSAEPNHVARAQIYAEGREQLDRIAEHFTSWSATRDLRPTVVAKQPGFVRLEVFLPYWTDVSDFLFYWLGHETFRRVLREASEADAQVGAQLRALRREVGGLTAQILQMQEAMRQRDQNLKAGARAFLWGDTLQVTTPLTVQS